MTQYQKIFLIKKLLYQSKNRGCKEMDLILGKFAEKFIPEMDIEELQSFAKILEQNDSDIYDWITCKSNPPTYLSSEVINRLLRFDLN